MVSIEVEQDGQRYSITETEVGCIVTFRDEQGRTVTRRYSTLAEAGAAIRARFRLTHAA